MDGDNFRDPDYFYPDSEDREQELEIPANEVPFDPVLRLALIKKGLITPDDLIAADKEIRVVSMIQEARNGKQPAE